VRSLPGLRNLFWVPEGCFTDMLSMAQASNYDRMSPCVKLTRLRAVATTEPIGDFSAKDPLFVAKLSPGKVVGDSLLVANAKDYVAANLQALHGVEDPVNNWVLRRCRFRRRVQVSGITAVLAAGAGANYFHWLFESVPRLRLLTLAGYDLSQIDHFVVSQVQQRFQVQTLLLLGIPFEKLLPGHKAKVLECSQLLIPSLPAPPMVFPSWTIDFLRGSFIQAAEPMLDRQRLFISRRLAARRRLANEAAVEECLRPAGFKTVCLENRSFAEQVGLFASASVIVAVHGAGLANLAFSSPGTKVVELVGPTFVNHCYRGLAQALGMSYCEVIGTLATKPRRRPEEDDFYAEPARLQQALERVGL
jgi:capsular polysaccharide biosynthesis protein